MSRSIDGSSLKWDKISTRGAYQAIKFATAFFKITGGLAYIGFNECLANMHYHAFWLKDLHDIYFEIWLRVTKQKSFRNALEEVYKLDKFPLLQGRMKYAFENENGFSDMEMEFCTCTTGVTSDVTEDKAHRLITDAIKKVERPMLYEHYVQKKIAVAQSIGLITKDLDTMANVDITLNYRHSKISFSLFNNHHPSQGSKWKFERARLAATKLIRGYKDMFAKQRNAPCISAYI